MNTSVPFSGDACIIWCSRVASMTSKQPILTYLQSLGQQLVVASSSIRTFSHKHVDKKIHVHV